MAESSTLTIRIDEELKRALERASVAENRNVTDFVVRAIKTRIAPQCSQCGRSDQPGYLPPGLSPAMDEYLRDHKERNLSATVTLTGVSHGRQVAYWARIRNDTVHEGMLMVQLLFGEWDASMNMLIERGSIPIPLPRGTITGWKQDSGVWFQMLTALGYLDGNAQVRNALQMHQFGTVTSAVRQPPRKSR